MVSKSIPDPGVGVCLGAGRYKTSSKFKGMMAFQNIIAFGEEGQLPLPHHPSCHTQIISDQDLLSLYMMTIQKYELNLFMDSGFL